jgi:dTDP-4-amino-4,6-dideoxy-D-galactose acyltransferase
MLNEFIESRKDILFFYSQYCHLRKINKDLLFNHTVRDKILHYENDGLKIIESIEISGRLHHFLFKYLEWDSTFNKVPTFKLEYILFNHDEIRVVSEAISRFVFKLLSGGDKYVFFEIPTEDIFLIQALGMSGFRLVETRINQYLDDLKSHNYPRYKVRRAVESDINVLREISICNRNNYDRLHADVFIDNHLADNYLATFTENSIKGFSDVVLVPDEPGIPTRALLAANFLKKDSELLNCNISRLALAVSDPVCKGWFAKLTSEFIYLSAEKGVEYVMTTTQSANPGSFRSVEKLNFKLGSVNHLFSI